MTTHPLDALADLHRRLRRGDFGKDLLEVVRTSAKRWQSLPGEDSRLRAQYLVAEVLDYFGFYAEADEHLRDVGPAQRAIVRRKQFHRDADPSISKWRIWVSMAYATSLYRKASYSRALAVLGDCAGALKALDPSTTALFGTRARLAHLRGQALRQRHDYSAAERQFEAAVVFARRRFDLKTPSAELSPQHPSGELSLANPKDFERERLLAHWTIGKCLALGLGWIAYTTGRLSPAAMLLSAGYGLLRGTGDGVHRAYAKLLLGAVARAEAGDEEERLRDAIAVMRDAAQGLEEHPIFSLRASYELALAYSRLKDERPKARSEINRLKDGLGRTHSLSVRARWTSAALVVESRVERLDGDLSRARQLASQAVSQADAAGKSHTEVQAEALIALGETLLAQAVLAENSGRKTQGANCRQDAIDRFRGALSLARDNPKVLAVCNLHLARAYGQRGSLGEALEARAAAKAHEPSIDHGFVRKLAEEVDTEIEARRYFVIDGQAITLKQPAQLRALQAFLVRQGKAYWSSPADLAEQLEIPEKTVRELLRELGLANPPGRPPRSTR